MHVAAANIARVAMRYVSYRVSISRNMCIAKPYDGRLVRWRGGSIMAKHKLGSWHQKYQHQQRHRRRGSVMATAAYRRK